MMLLSILIITHDRLGELQHALTSCALLAASGSEIIVVDQLKNKAVRELCEQYDAKYFHINSNSLSQSRNFGITRCSGNSILFLDDDAQLPESSVELLANNLINRDLTGFVANVVCLEDPTQNFSRHHRNFKSSVIDIKNFDKVLSCGMCIPRIWLMANLFDERFGVGAIYGAGEETDLILRLLEKNKIVYLENFKVIHPCSGNLSNQGNILLKFFNYGQGTGALLAKHQSKISYSKLTYYFFGPIYLIIMGSILLQKDKIFKGLGLLAGRVSGYFKFKIAN